jgi:hypothetical protein
MSLRKLGLLLLILGFGAAVEAAWLIRTHSPEGLVWGFHRGRPFSFESDREAGAAARVLVENSFGSVRVVSAEGGPTRVHLRTVVRASSEAAARRVADRVRLQVEESEGRVRLWTDRGDLERGPFAPQVETHLEVTVPGTAELDVQNRHGAIEIAGVAAVRVTGSFETVHVERIAGATSIEAEHADVRAREIAGALTIQARHGDVEIADIGGPSQIFLDHGSLGAARTAALAVRMEHGRLTAREVRGDLGLEGQHAEADASDVSGTCVMTTSFESIRLERVGAAVRITTDHGGVHVVGARSSVNAQASFDDVHLQDVEGPVEVAVSHGGAQVDGLAQGGRLRTSGDDLVVTGFRGPIDAGAERASVSLQPRGPIRDPIEARSRFGNVTLGVSPDSRLSVEATTSRGGDLELEAPGLVMQHSGATEASGQVNGGGVRIVLAADHGDVRLEPSRPE